MKKKLKLNDLQVKSFVTEVEKSEVKGGAQDTLYSCLAYITCDIVKCYLTTQANNCIGTAA
jgi:hypothetical protein